MKSIMKKSLAVVMVLSMLLSLALPVFAVNAHTHEGDNTPCDCGAAVETEVVEATCMEHGGTWNTCTVCGDTWVTKETPKLPYDDPDSHQLSTEAIAKEATCWAPGHTAAKACTVEGCNYSEGGVEIPQYTHGDPETDELSSLVVDEKTLTSCLEGGVITYKCQFAGVEGSQCSGYNGEHDKFAEPAGHKHELRATGYQAPTCSAKGWVTIDCTVCEDTFKVAIASKGHDFVEVVGVPAICYEQGYYAGYYCANEWIEWDEEGNGTKKSCAAYYITEAGHVAGSDVDPLYTETDLNEEALAIPATNTHNKVLVWNPEKDAAPVPEYKGELAYQQANCDPDNKQNGWQWWVCAEEDCDWDYKETLEPNHVDDGTYNQVTAPTCTARGYTKHICKICGNPYIDPDSYTAPQHTWGSEDPDNTIYTFVKEGMTYVQEGDVRALPAGLTATIHFIPYYVPASQLESDATAQKLMKDGYSKMAWTVMAEVKCGKVGRFAHVCVVDGCKDAEGSTTAGFLFIEVDHVWDGNFDTVEKVAASCTAPGGYVAECTVCEDDFILSAAMVGEYDPDYTGEIPATGHMSNKGPIIAKDPVSREFLYPVEDEIPATCVALGTPEFNYCNNENCPEGLEDYETAKAAVKDTLPMIAHQYYDEDGEAYKTVRIPVSCMYASFEIAKCKTCDLRIDKDPVHNPADPQTGKVKDAWEFRIEGTEEGEFDGTSHVYKEYENGRPVATPPTCATPGRWADIKCTLCSYSDIGTEIPVLDPGEVPTYNESMKDGDVVESPNEGSKGWLITVIAPKCTTPGEVVATCLDCQGKTHETTVIHTFEKTGIHFIKDATYVKNENGSYMTVKGSYVVDRKTLTNVQASCSADNCATEHVANAGGCAENVNNLHAAHYECAECDAVIFFSVRLDHVAGQTECGKPTTCTECEKVLVEAEPHVMAKVDPAEAVNPDANCATEFYYHIACTQCGFGSRSQGFEWTDEWKVIAEYVPALDHDFNDMEDSTCEKDMECVREGCDHVEKAKKGHDVTEDYQAPTCITLGYKIYRCAAGEACDKEGAVIVEIGGVKYAEWRELDASSVYADHDYDVDNDGKNDIYLDNDGNCLTFNVDVYRCENCYKTATVDEDGFISHGYIVENFEDPTGHEWIEVKLAPTCGTPGYVQNVCKNCFNLSLECVDPEHDATNCADCKDIRADEMHKTPDFEGKLGYDVETATVLNPTGHYYWSTPAAGATQEEIDNFVAEKIYFEFTCQDAIEHRVPVLDQDGEPTGEYTYPACADCQVALRADMHQLTDTFYEKEVTCTENGLVWYACVVDGCTYRTITQVVLALGHAQPYWKDDVAATCCATGSAYLACHVCDAAIAEGDLVTALTEGETLPEGETFVAYEATADQLTKVLDKLDHDFENGTVVSEEPATIHNTGKKVVQCALFCGVDADGEPVQCTVTETTEEEKLDHVEFSAVIENVVAPDHYVFVNGGRISYTIFIDGENKDLYGLNFNVVYDASKLTFVDFDLGEDNANIFGTIDPSGACNTWVGGTKEGVVSILATASPTEDGEIGYVTVNEKQEFVTLYFDINADTVTDDPFDAGYVTAIEIKNVTLEGISIGGDQTSPEIMFGNDYDHEVVDAEAITVEKLGDVNVIKDDEGNMLLSDKILNVRDVNAIEKLILEDGYDVRADINQDGDITSADLIAVQRYIINAHSYAEMVGAE